MSDGGRKTLTDFSVDVSICNYERGKKQRFEEFSTRKQILPSLLWILLLSLFGLKYLFCNFHFLEMCGE